MRLSCLLFCLFVARIYASCVRDKRQSHTLVWNIDGEYVDSAPYRNIKSAMRIWQDSTCLTISTNQFSANNSIDARIWFYKKHGCQKVILQRDSFGLKAIVDVSCIASNADAMNYVFTALKLIHEAKDCANHKNLNFNLRKFPEEGARSFAELKQINEAYCSDACPKKKNCNSGFQAPRFCGQCICPEGREGESCQIKSKSVVCGHHLNLNATTSWSAMLNYGKGACANMIQAPPGHYLYGKIRLQHFNGPECHGDICHCTPSTGVVRILFFDRAGTYRGDQKYCQHDARVHLLSEQEGFDQYPTWQIDFVAPTSAMKLHLEFKAVREPIRLKISFAGDHAPLSDGSVLGLFPADA